MHYYPNPRRHGRRRLRLVPKQFRAELKALKAKQRKLYRMATPVERGLSKLFKRIEIFQENERDSLGKEIHIGRKGKIAEKIKIGQIDLLKLVETVKKKASNAALSRFDRGYARLEKKLDRLMAKTRKKTAKN